MAASVLDVKEAIEARNLGRSASSESEWEMVDHGNFLFSQTNVSDVKLRDEERQVVNLMDERIRIMDNAQVFADHCRLRGNDREMAIIFYTGELLPQRQAEWLQTVQQATRSQLDMIEWRVDRNTIEKQLSYLRGERDALQPGDLMAALMRYEQEFKVRHDDAASTHPNEIAAAVPDDELEDAQTLARHLIVRQPHQPGLNEVDVKEHNDRTPVVSAPPSIVPSTIGIQFVNNAEVLDRGRLEAGNQHQTEARAVQLQNAALRHEVEQLRRAHAAEVQRSKQLAAKINIMQPKLAEFQRLEAQRKAQEAKRIADARKKAIALAAQKTKALAAEKAENTKIAKTFLNRKGGPSIFSALKGMEPSKAAAVLTAYNGLLSAHQAAIATENARAAEAYTSAMISKGPSCIRK